MNKLATVKQKLKNKKGFTLVEMIIVMVIMAILAAALVPTMMGFVKDARNSAHLATARAYYVAAQSVGSYLLANDTALTSDAVTKNTRWTTMIEGLAGSATVTISADQKNIASITYQSGTTKGDTTVTINAGGEVTFDKIT